MPKLTNFVRDMKHRNKKIEITLFISLEIEIFLYLHRFKNGPVAQLDRATAF